MYIAQNTSNCKIKVHINVTHSKAVATRDNDDYTSEASIIITSSTTAATIPLFIVGVGVSVFVVIV